MSSNQGETITGASVAGESVAAATVTCQVRTIPDESYVAEGDSITADPNSWARIVVPNLPVGVVFYDAAVSGTGLTAIEARAWKLDEMLVSDMTGKTWVLTLLTGAIDFYGNVIDTTAYAARVQAYCEARKASGWNMVICTTLPRVQSQEPSDSNFETNRNAYNTIVRGWGASTVDGLIDFAANATMGPQAAATNTSLYGDGIHPTAAGHVVLEGVARPVLVGIFP